jgi:hypothetical protein
MAIVVAQAEAGKFAEAQTTADGIGAGSGRAKALREIAWARVQASVAMIENPGHRARKLHQIATAEAQATAAMSDKGRDFARTRREIVAARVAALEAVPSFALAQVVAGMIENPEDRFAVLREIVTKQAKAGNLDDALSTADMVLTGHISQLNEIGSAMASLKERDKATATLNAYLPRAARYVESAWHSCGVIAHLYPGRSADLADFLAAAFSQHVS